MMRKIALMAVVLNFGCLVGLADAADCTVTYGEGVTTITVADGKTVDIKDATDGTLAVVTALTGERQNDTLVKDGPGLLVFSQDISAFVGAVTIAEGRATVNHKAGLGKTGVASGPVTIADGATLMVDSTLYYDEGYVENMAFHMRPLTFGGFGPDGQEGVMTSKKGKALYCIFKEGRKTMSGDALWNGADGRIDIRFGTFDMGGHVFHTTNSVGMTSCTVENPGHIVVHKGGLSLETSPNFAGGATNTLSFEAGSSVSFKNCNTPIDWTVQVNGNAVFSSLGGGATTNANCFAGPVVIATGATFSKSSGTNTISGPLVGAGTLKVDNGSAVLNLTCPSNSFTGKVVCNSGTLNVYGLGCLPGLDADHLQVAAAVKFNLVMSDADFAALSDEDKWKIFTYNSTAAAPLALPGELTISRTDGYNLTSVKHKGPGELTLTGAAEGGVNRLGSMEVTGGTLRLEDMGVVDAAIDVNSVGAAWPDVARLVFGGDTAYLATSQPTSDPAKGATTNIKSYVKVGYAGWKKNLRGIVEILDDVIVSNRFNLGCDSDKGSAGSLFMRGGRVVTHFTNWNASETIGSSNAGSSGYMEITGGSMQVGGAERGQWLNIGSAGPGAGVVTVDGGLLCQTNQGLTVAASGGTGEVHVASGTFIPCHTTIGGYVHRTTARDGWAVLNQTGGTIAANGEIYFGGMSNGMAIASFAGGVLNQQSFYGVENQSRLKSGVNIPYADNRKYVNFNGGTMKRRGTMSRIFRDSFTRFTVFAGGVTFDSENESGVGANMTFDYPLEAPSGKGVASIKVPELAKTPWTYIGAPFVWIVDPTGRGYGASAHADFDSTTGVITGITVVAPGCDYGEGTYARLDYGGYTEQVVIPATDVILAESASGGVTKIGAGTLKLTCANAYAGWTRVEAGTLDLTVAGAFPAGASLDLAGGEAVFAANAAVTVANLRGNAGCANVGVKVTGELIVDCAKMTPGEQFVIGGTLDLTDATVRLVNVPTENPAYRIRNFVRATGGIVGDYAVAGVPPEWHLTKSANGQTLSFGFARGLLVIVK